MNKVYLGLEVYDDHYSSFEKVVKVFKSVESAQQWAKSPQPTEYIWRGDREIKEFEVE